MHPVMYLRGYDCESLNGKWLISFSAVLLKDKKYETYGILRVLIKMDVWAAHAI